MINIGSAFFLKGMVAILTLWLVPLTLKCLDKSNFGLWMNISTLISWFYLLDIGLAHGFRSKFTRSISLGHEREAKQLVSTTYAMVLGICMLSAILFFAITPHINWLKILNVSALEKNQLDIILSILFYGFLAKLVLSVISSVLLASHKVYLSNLIDFFTYLIIFIATWFISLDNENNLERIAWVNSFSPVLVLFVFTLLLFGTKFKPFRPSPKEIKFNHLKGIFSKGLQFFIIQISGLLLFSTGNFLVSYFFGNESVADYSVLSKYFGVPMIGFNVVMVPFWAGFADAYHKNDIPWINSIIRKLLTLWSFLVVGLIAMGILAPWIIPIWAGDSVIVSQPLLWMNAAFVAISAWNTIFAFFINGTEHIRLQMITSVVVSIFNIPLAFLLVKGFDFGPEGVLLATLISIFPATILFPAQVKLLVNKKAKGIWLK